MAKVEELLGVARFHQSAARADKPVATTPLPLLGTVVVKGNRSHFHGQNDRVTLLNQVCFLSTNNFLTPSPYSLHLVSRGEGLHQ